ncbi:MAG: PAS domain S-box protein [Rhodocyclaceae bacterium]|nr:PAS domain S-box protein [Rhodocyclaceae bacterium]
MRERGRELQAVAELKIEFVRAWLEERRSDTAVNAGRLLVSRFLASRRGDAGPGRPDDLQSQLHTFRAIYGYEAVLLLDRTGRQRLGSGAPSDEAYGNLTDTASRAMQAGKIVVSRAYHAGSDGRRHTGLDIAAPVFDSERTGRPVVGALVLHLNPREYLDSLLQRWPGPSESGETFLVESVEGRIAYLSALRHADASALLKKDDDPYMPAALAARGQQGVTEGIDYRGVPVVAAVGQVPGMPWFVIAKLDRAEILAPVRRETLWSGVLSSLLVLALGLALLAWQRRGRSEFALAQQAAAKATLTASEARFRRLHEHGWDSNLLFDRRMVIQYASPAADRLLGRPAKGEPITAGTALVHPDDVGKVEAARLAALDAPGVPQFVEHRLSRRDGSWFTVEASFTNHFDDPDIGALAYTARDVSDRIEAERRQHESEERYRFLFENNPLPMWVYDKMTLAFLEVNRAAVSQYGYTREEFLAMTLRDIRPPEDVSALEEEVKSDRRREGRIWTHRRKDGSLLKAAVWGQDSRLSGRPERMILAENVTARVAAEQALRESEERYRSLFELSLDTVFVHRNDIILYANKAAAQLLRADSARMLVGRNGREFIAEKDQPMVESRFASLLSGEAAFLPPAESQLLTLDGQAIQAEAISARIMMEGAPAIMTVVRDISERRQAEALRLAEACRQRDTLVREVHHRIKNHLQGLTGLLNQHKQKHPVLQEALDTVIAQITAISLIHGLQSREVEGEVRLYGLLKEIVAFHAGMASLAFANDDQPECLNCAWHLADAESVPHALILNELITNAIKHRDEPSAPVRVACACNDENIVVTLGNAGTLPPGFDFAAGAGLGTGLTLLRSLLPRNGAALSFTCKDGQVETRLVLSAPVVSRQAADSAPARPPEGR